MSQILGLGMILFGLTTLVMHVRYPSKLKKLEPIQKVWGPKLGKTIHVCAYVLMPLGLGLKFLLK